MNALPLSALHPTTRARLEALAVEWLGFDPWSFDPDLADGTWIDIRGALDFDAVLPLHLGAGFDLGCRLVAEYERIEVVDAHIYCADVARLRAILLDLGRE